MIGKGAKYLQAAGYGRYRITAASLGSLDLFGSFGWLMPATRQAIMDAFGVDGKAVIAATNEYLNGIAASDKAKATALAGFINEDPMMVCSLPMQQYLPQGFVMPVRWLVGDGNTYISGVFSNTDGYRLKTKIRRTGNANIESVAGSCYHTGNKYWRSSLFINNSTFYLQCYGDYTETSFNFVLNQEFDIDYCTKRNYSITIDGTLVKSGTQNFDPSVGYDLAIFGQHYNNQYTNMLKNVQVGNRVELYTTDMDNPAFILAPIISDTKNGVVDILNGVYYPKSGSGTFGKAYTRNGQRWTPPTP